MECKYAYVKNGINYVLCKCQGEPSSDKMQDVAHCMCGHQRFCTQIKHCTLLPTWQYCQTKKQADKKAADAMAEIFEKTSIAKAKRSNRRRKQ